MSREKAFALLVIGIIILIAARDCAVGQGMFDPPPFGRPSSRGP